MIVAGITYNYNKKRKGKYNLLKVFQFHKQPPGPSMEQRAWRNVCGQSETISSPSSAV